MKIELYTPDRAIEIADLFHRSVHAIDLSVYTPEQKEAWAPTPPDYEYWAQRLSQKRPLLAIKDNRVVGFIELDLDGHIDCMYTHPEFQGKGVASALYEHLQEQAKARKIDRLYVEASFVAKPFFENRGFSVVKQNEMQRKGVALINFTMEKHLNPNNQIQ
ncbi:GNAT family N-acetyltransferase [Pseudogulbenkiania sp. MAI-1]|uniref:GNAT family N-acetyltransferase n=1 Tax=Pseudogulbenkiania sp. MAI-1 TaxID=990370 RepID=UPI00045E9490|nr:GNAT family N-acetyltransferase [Pseudogulbenkiania sp. MAI-1]